MGGTIGDIEGMPFIEAFRQFQFRVGRQNFFSVHVSLVPQVSYFLSDASFIFVSIIRRVDNEISTENSFPLFKSLTVCNLLNFKFTLITDECLLLLLHSHDLLVNKKPNLPKLLSGSLEDLVFVRT